MDNIKLYCILFIQPIVALFIYTLMVEAEKLRWYLIFLSLCYAPQIIIDFSLIYKNKMKDGDSLNDLLTTKAIGPDLICALFLSIILSVILSKVISCNQILFFGSGLVAPILFAKIIFLLVLKISD